MTTRRLGLRPLLTLAASAVLALGLTSGPATGGTPRPSPAAPTGTTAAPVPWDRVGPDWRLTVVSRGPLTDSGVRPRHQVLELIDPAGTAYPILDRDVPRNRAGWALQDWSDDGHRALLVDYGGRGLTSFTVVDLVTGAATRVPFRTESGTGQLSPDGQGLLVSQIRDQGGERVLHVAWDGTTRRLAENTNGFLVGGGVTLLSSKPKHRSMTVLDTTGAVLRTVATPGSCFAVRWWSPGVALASCWTHHASRLRLVPVDGSRQTWLTARRGSQGPDLGDIDAYRLGHRLFLEASGPCGYVFVARQRRDGSAAQVEVPGARGSVLLLGTQAGRLVIATTLSCDGGTPARPVLALLTPRTHAVTPLVRLARNEDFGLIVGFGDRHASMY